MRGKNAIVASYIATGSDLAEGVGVVIAGDPVVGTATLVAADDTCNGVVAAPAVQNDQVAVVLKGDVQLLMSDDTTAPDDVRCVDDGTFAAAAANNAIARLIQGDRNGDLAWAVFEGVRVLRPTT